MENRGILDSIRVLLRDGNTTGDLIVQGYAPGSVYKANQQIRRDGQQRRHRLPVLPTTDALPIDVAEQVTALAVRIESAVGSIADRSQITASLREMMTWLLKEYEQDLNSVEEQWHAAVMRASELESTLAEMKPLLVWAALPCAICHQPLSDAVSRDVALETTKHLAHRQCMEERSRDRYLDLVYLDQEIAAS